MSYMTKQEKLEIMQADLLKKKIQKRQGKIGVEWEDKPDDEDFNFVLHVYRVKPEVKREPITVENLIKNGATHVKYTYGKQIHIISQYETGNSEKYNGIYISNQFYNMITLMVQEFKWTNSLSSGQWYSFETEGTKC